MTSLDLEKLQAVKTVKLPGDLLSLDRAADSEQLWVGSSDCKVYGLDLAEDKPQTVHSGRPPELCHRRGPGRRAAHHRQLGPAADLVGYGQSPAGCAPCRPISGGFGSSLCRRMARSWPVLPTIWSPASGMPQSGKLIRELKGHALRLPRYEYPNKLYACAFSPDGKFLAANDETAQVIVWEVASGKEAARFQAATFYHGNDWERNNHPYGGLRCLAFAPDGQSLALAGIQNTDVAIINGHALVQVYDWQAGKQTHEFKTTGSTRSTKCCAITRKENGCWPASALAEARPGCISSTWRTNGSPRNWHRAGSLVWRSAKMPRRFTQSAGAAM